MGIRSVLKKFVGVAVSVAALLGGGLVHAFTPQAGSWIVTAENNGQPGRGFGLDVQGSTLVMQMYAYDAAGNSTFYLSAGKINDHRYSGELNQYRNGPYFGSGPMSGREVGSAGRVSMRFVSGTKGYITFPNEQEKEISRFNFAYGSDPASLRGIWLFSPLTSSTPTSDFVALNVISKGTANGTGLVSTNDFRFACENQVRGDLAGTVLCVKLNSSGQTTRAYLFTYSVNDGEGYSGPASRVDSDLLVVRRLTNANEDGTGVIIKDAPASEEATQQARALLLSAFEQVAAQQNPAVE